MPHLLITLQNETVKSDYTSDFFFFLKQTMIFNLLLLLTLLIRKENNHFELENSV